ncbi:MAG: hypothetical protein CMA08_04885 [Euryarchaeota archaeon]|nr:hypothetical protein [Euryarchaeota archaeon]DAC07257.1 MAG TPA: hypothetical protein D7H88_06210 [Candidatus Poseidoniales archaeon]HII20797.1 hypothetical protein [Poseidonia sp.]
MPKLTDEDFKRAMALGNAIDMNFEKPDEDLPLTSEEKKRVRGMLNDEEDGIMARILKSHSAFPDEEIANLISLIYHKADLDGQGWNSVAEIIFHEYMGGNAGPEATRALFDPF